MLLKDHVELNLPQDLLEQFPSAIILESKQGRLSNNIIKFEDSKMGVCYLNISKDFAKIELNNEHNCLKQYQSYFFVPKILYFTDLDDYSYLITSCIPGQPLHMMCNTLSEREIITIVGQALLEISSLPITKNIDNGLNSEIELIKTFLEKNQINEDDFFKENGCTPVEMFKTIIKERSNHDDNHLTHGDFCIPNIIVLDNKISGIIDWGKCGIGDIYRDLSSIKGSMTRNIGHSAMIDLFEIVGMNYNEYSENKIEYYKKIDQFWYNLIN